MEIGKIYFYTATINKWLHVLGNDECKEIILDSLKYLVKNNAVDIYSFVIMPNHIHLVWRIIEISNVKDVQLSFMKFTAQKLKFWLEENDSELLSQLKVEKKDRIYQIWQRNPLAVEIYNPLVCEQKMEYIHNNPCQGKWNLADEPVNYKYSSSSFYEKEDSKYEFLSHYKVYV